MYKHGIVFFSPAGSTRLIAETIEYHLRLKGCSPFLVDLSRGRQASLEEVQTMVGHPCCIWMGSPVYCDHAVPLMHDPGSVSVRPCVSFVVRDRSIKVNFIGRLRAIKMACERTPRRAVGDGILQEKPPNL